MKKQSQLFQLTQQNPELQTAYFGFLDKLAEAIEQPVISDAETIRYLRQQLAAQLEHSAKLQQELDEAHAAIAEFVIIADAISTIIREAA